MENLKSMSNKEKNKQTAKLQWESWIVDLEKEDQSEQSNTSELDDDVSSFYEY